ncbi:hypothetical protein MHO82_06055 [Vibrio sp. Of7-15]|uniref:hypothetical protein n=1 Tax=Vibrio sp. Of7-15 TaxID=2724879 RepID=UPI001EF267F9|nr:hypothetical protein [Vibrio sp. Of7-15]MCG7496418.1 hypothetical protein [Vibrio sp. Of7-15]
MYKKLACVLVFSLIMTGCISNQYVENPKQLIEDSPYISKLTHEKFEPRTEMDKIELHYVFWSPFTRPDAVQNWKYLYVMGETSSPNWDYIKLSDVVVAQRERDDKVAVAELLRVAYSQGGDGIIDLYREPMIDAPKFGAKIIGFRYFGTVVRREN